MSVGSLRAEGRVNLPMTAMRLLEPLTCLMPDRHGCHENLSMRGISRQSCRVIIVFAFLDAPQLHLTPLCQLLLLLQ